MVFYFLLRNRDKDLWVLKQVFKKKLNQLRFTIIDKIL